MKATNIKWDTDGEYISELPTEVVIPDNVDPEDVADWLSDTYGFCVFSYEEEPVGQKQKRNTDSTAGYEEREGVIKFD